MLVGDTRTFRAVGKDGRIRHNVAWAISPPGAAELTTSSDEATVRALNPYSNVVLSANSNGDSAEASIEIRSEKTLTPGTKLWSVDALPGCKSEKLTEAMPTANGPDLYAQETCPDGTFIRAFTADGRELWRRKLGDWSVPVSPNSKVKEQTRSGEHINPSADSICDSITLGATKDAVAKLVDQRKLPLNEKERAGDRWVLEEQGSRCMIFFDAGVTVKKQKIIISH